MNRVHGIPLPSQSSKVSVVFTNKETCSERFSLPEITQLVSRICLPALSSVFSSPP